MILEEVYFQETLFTRLRQLFFNRDESIKQKNFGMYNCLDSFIYAGFQKDKHNILKNILCKERAMYCLLSLGSRNIHWHDKSFYHFFWRYTIKNYAFQLEEYIIGICPVTENEQSADDKIKNVLLELFYCNNYCMYLDSYLTNYKWKSEDFNIISVHSMKYIKHLFSSQKSTDKEKLQNLIFKIVRCGDRKYWKYKTQDDLFLNKY